MTTTSVDPDGGARREDSVAQRVQAERDRIAARLRRMVDYHAEYPLNARTSHELLLAVARDIEEGTE